MAGIRALSIVAILSLVAGCLPAPPPAPTAGAVIQLSGVQPRSPTPAPTPSAVHTPTSVPPTATTPAPTPTQRYPTALPASARLRLKCFALLAEPRAGLQAAGTLWLVSNTNTLVRIDGATGEQRLPDSLHESAFSFAVSPNQAQIAFRRIVRDQMRIQTLEDSLVIAAESGRVVSVQPWHPHWSALAGWLDEERLVINASARFGEEALGKKPATLVVLHTVSGRQRALSPDFPNLNLEYPVPDWAGWGVTMYDPSLTRVVYPYDAHGRYDAGYTLWDVPGRQVLAHIPASLRTLAPRWSPDGSRFVVAAAHGSGPSWLAFELYSARRDGGAVERLTFLTEYYRAVYIQAYTWSPDGRQIAFWIVENPQGVPFIEHGEAHLAILDTATGEVTNTCVPGDHDASTAPPRVPPPLWSPDGTQLLVENSAKTGPSQLLLVDLAREEAVVIAHGLQPVGWLTGP